MSVHGYFVRGSSHNMYRTALPDEAYLEDCKNLRTRMQQGINCMYFNNHLYYIVVTRLYHDDDGDDDDDNASQSIA